MGSIRKRPRNSAAEQMSSGLQLYGLNVTGETINGWLREAVDEGLSEN